MLGGQMAPLLPIVRSILPGSTVEFLTLGVEDGTRLILPETHAAALLNAERPDVPTVLSYWKRSDPTPPALCIVPDAFVAPLMIFFGVSFEVPAGVQTYGDL